MQDHTTRVKIGECPVCGRPARVKKWAVVSRVQITCRCGHKFEVHPPQELVDKSRKEKSRYYSRQSLRGFKKLAPYMFLVGLPSAVLLSILLFVTQGFLIQIADHEVNIFGVNIFGIFLIKFTFLLVPYMFVPLLIGGTLFTILFYPINSPKASILTTAGCLMYVLCLIGFITYLMAPQYIFTQTSLASGINLFTKIVTFAFYGFSATAGDMKELKLLTKKNRVEQ